MPDIREEFEEWFAEEIRKTTESLPPYFVSTLQLSKEPMWRVWQASRAAMKVEIPKPESWMRYEDHIACIMEALQQAGIEVK